MSNGSESTDRGDTQSASSVTRVLSVAISVSAVVVSLTQAYVPFITKRYEIEVSTAIRVQQILLDSGRDLFAVNDDGSVDLETRLGAIGGLEFLSLELETEVPESYRRRAIDLLTHYVTANAAIRKSGPGVRRDRGRFRVEDIRASLVALQRLRSATGLPVHLRGANFSHHILTDLNLAGFDFEGAYFNNAFLTRSCFREAVFREADLTGVVVWGAADFNDADFGDSQMDTRATLDDIQYTNADAGIPVPSSIPELVESRGSVCRDDFGIP